MEIKLVQQLPQLYLPFLDVLDVVAIELFRFVFGTDEFNSKRHSQGFLLTLIFRPHDLEY